MNAPAKTAATLAAELRSAKRVEDAAKEHRTSIESQLVDLFTVPDGGEGRHKDEDFTIEWKVTRSVDSGAVQASWNDMSANVQKAFKVKFDLDLKGYRAINDLDKESAAAVAKFVTTKPAKPSITLKDQDGI